MASHEDTIRTAPLDLLAVEMARRQEDASPREDLLLLIQRSKAGDLKAFEQLILLHERRVLRTALRLLTRPEDAQDAAQEVYLRLYRHFRRFDERRDFSTWLYRITVNVCRDVHRRRQRNPTLSLDEMGARVPPVEPQADSLDPFDEFAKAEERRIMTEALAVLPEKERAAVVLRDLEGLSTAQVAEVLGSSETTVRSQISRARLKLKAEWERRQKERK